MDIQTFQSIFVLALLAEAVIEVFKNVQEKNTEVKYWVILAVSWLIGIGASVNWDIDFFALAGLGEGQLPILGNILTGLIVSRGSNLVHDLIGIVTSQKAAADKGQALG